MLWPPEEGRQNRCPKKLQGIREVRRMYWIDHNILQIATGLTSTLKFHVAEIEFREAMHFPGATPEEYVPSAPVTLYKAERVNPNEHIGSCF
jgi:hypothetical protein